MKLSKRIITVISSMLVVGSGVGVGVGLLHLESKPKKEIKNLKELITITNLETIHESNMNRDDLINLIRKRNPDLNLDFDRLELDIYKYERKVIVKPKHEDTTYQGEVEIAFNLSSKLSDLL
ncbi:hypothetical protein JIY74_30290 [Vibrio harveyi]|nr:hypothetical protein [Vibrio harveyi]